MRFNFHICILALFLSCLSIDNIAAEKKEINNAIQDPFARGVLKPPQYGSNLDRTKSSNGRLDDIRSLNDLRYYRVLGIYENTDPSMHDVIEINASEKEGASYHAFYIALGSSSEKKLAQQLSKDFINTLTINLNRSVIIKASKDSLQGFADREVNNKKKAPEKDIKYEVEYGPFNSPELASATCYFLKSKTNQFPLECDAIKKRLVYKSEKTKEMTGSATVGLSQTGLTAMKDPALAFSQKDLLDTVLTVYEGETLSAPDFFIVKINQYGIYLANKFDEVMLIPAVTFPVNNPNISSPATNLPAGAPSSNSPGNPVPIKTNP